MFHTRLRRTALAMSVLLVALLSGVAGNFALAQTTTADILGTVTDATGAVVPNADVSARDLGTGEVRTTKTSSRGDYVFPALQVGSYSISVTVTSFKTFDVPSIAVAAGDRARVDAHLEVGITSENVVVHEVASALQTDSSASGDLLVTKSVQDLPLNGRNYVNLLQITAGVNASQPSSAQSGNRNLDRRQTSAYSANGQSDFYNNNMIDGLDNNAGSYLAVRPSVEAIQEIRVLTNNYSADLGHAAGAVANVVTKSGTNEFHGSAYEYLRNDIFDARDYFARTGSKPELRLNQFGGSIGGPIVKNKVFFFGDAEEFRLIKAATGLYTVPTAYEMAHPGDFSDQCDPFASTPTNCVPGPVLPRAALNPIGLDYFNLYPATGQIPGLFANNYQGTTRTIQNITTVDTRIDYQFRESDSLSGRYAYNPSSTATPSPFPAVNGIQSGASINGISGYNDVTTQNAQLGYTHIFKPTLLMQLGTGYTRYQGTAKPLNYGKNIPESFGIKGVNLPSVPGTSGMTNFTPVGYASLGDVISEPQATTWNVLQANGALTYIRGAHTFKFGGAFIHREDSTFGDTFPVGLVVFGALDAKPYLYFPFSLEAMLLGVPEAALRSNQLYALLLQYREPSVYFMDNWHAAPKLTLNLGVRYEVFPPNTEKRNRGSNFNLSTLSMDVASSSDPHLGLQTGYEGVSPRVGFALELPHQAAMHGGFGITFYPVYTNDEVGVGNVPAYFTNTTTLPYASVSSLVVPTAINPATFASNKNVTTVTSLPQNLRNLYIEQFSLELQKQFGANVATVGYVGELGRRLPWSYNADIPLPPGPGSAVVPNYVYQTQFPYLTTIAVNNNAASMAYNSLRVELQRRTTNGLTINANYTYARGLTSTFSNSAYNGSSGVLGGLLPYASYDYGNSDLDVRNRFAASIAYEIPFGKNFTGVEGFALKDWQVNSIAYWQSGLPFTVVDSASVTAKNSSGTTVSVTQDLLPSGANADRPNMLHSAHISNPSITRYFDTTAFQLQTLGTAGSEGRNQIYGPHDGRVDLSLIKTFPVSERLSVQFRAECFNILNNPNFATPNSGVTSWNTNGTPNTTGTNFGQISSTNSAEIPRQFQFALKATF